MDVDGIEVISHSTMTDDGGEQGLQDLCLLMPQNETYESGGHIILYGPGNSRCMVDAFLQLHNLGGALPLPSLA